MEPWNRKDKSFHWRRNQLNSAAQKHGDRFIVYKKNQYGISLIEAGMERDKFYNDHESELFK